MANPEGCNQYKKCAGGGRLFKSYPAGSAVVGHPLALSSTRGYGKGRPLRGESGRLSSMMRTSEGESLVMHGLAGRSISKQLAKPWATQFKRRSPSFKRVNAGRGIIDLR